MEISHWWGFRSGKGWEGKVQILAQALNKEMDKGLRECNRGVSLEEWAETLLLYLLWNYVSTINTFSEWDECECDRLAFWCYFQDNE